MKWVTDEELYQFLSKCTAAHIALLIPLLRLPMNLLPGRNSPPAEQAAAIWELIQLPEYGGVEKLADKLGSVLSLELKLRPPKEDDPALLFISANPLDKIPLALKKELAVVTEILERAEYPHRHRVISGLDVDASGLAALLRENKPRILHISAHGVESGELLMGDQGNERSTLSPVGLGRFFEAIPQEDRPKYIVLNACYSERMAEVLAPHVSAVIGMADEFGDKEALEFSRTLYRELAGGTDIRAAFELACRQLDLAGLPDSLVPRLATGSAEVSVAAFGPPGGRIVRSLRDVSESRPYLYRIWYGTDRLPLREAKEDEFDFGCERSDGTIHYGTCTVSIPRSHLIGSVGSSWWDRWRSGPDDRLRVTVVQAMPEAEFWEKLKTELQLCSARQRCAFLYIHGYNVSFRSAAIRAAQLGFDLKVPGITAFFSWPSRGRLTGYAADTASIRWSTFQLRKFIAKLVRESGAEQVHVLAHSMGNRGLLQALETLSNEGDVRFGQIILAAPDEDARTVGQQTRYSRKFFERFTLYASSKDRALGASRFLYDSTRAGYPPPVHVFDEIDTLITDPVNISWLGHGYYGEARPVISDLHLLLWSNSGPDNRVGLVAELNDQGRRYWRFSG